MKHLILLKVIVQIKSKKSLGQNFLIDKNILNIISNSVEVKKDNEILEIGPGTGNLTEFLIKKNPKKIFLIEKDKDLVKILKDKFNKGVEIFNEDFLNFSNSKLLKNELIIFGNLPYNISSQILVKLIINKEKFHIKKMIFMFQKELADRIISDENSKNYGRLSVLAKWKFNINKVIDISPNSFLPKPKVKSTLLLFSPKDKILKLEKPENLEYVTRVFFNQRRKKIKKPLNVLFQNKTEIINRLNLDLNLRPQNLSFKTFFDITKEYEKLVR